MRFFSFLYIIIFFISNSLNAEYIIKTKKANLRAEPSVNSKIIGTLYEYESVKILKTQGSWVKVKTIDGSMGWISKTVIEKLDYSSNGDSPNKKTKDTNIKQQVSPPAVISNSQNQLPKQAIVSAKTEDNSNIKTISSSSDVSYTKPEEDLSKYYPKNDKKYKMVKERRRVIGEHIFPSTVLFPSPIPSARFGFSEGFGMVKGSYVYPYEDPDTGKTTLETQKVNYFGFDQKFDIGVVVTDNISFDLNVGI